jgi:hypothetical protein
MRAWRASALLLGLGVAAYGVWRLLDLGWANTRATLVWLVGGVVLHDAVFAPVVLVVTLIALRFVRRERLAPLAMGLLILVPVTLLAVPELGRFGARADRPTLLDRDYWLGWAVLATLVVVGVLVGTVATGRRQSAIPAGPTSGGGDDGPGDGRR